MKQSRSIQASRISIDTDALWKLRRVLKGTKLYVKVGVLGKSPTRSDVKGSMTNPAIGLVHEKGSRARNIPRRSFLDMPLSLKGPEALRANQKFLVEALAKGSLGVFFKKLGILGENIVQSAFETGGFGKWAPHKRKTDHALLIDTAQLRKSIMSEPAT